MSREATCRPFGVGRLRGGSGPGARRPGLVNLSLFRAVRWVLAGGVWNRVPLLLGDREKPRPASGAFSSSGRCREAGAVLFPRLGGLPHSREIQVST